MITDTITAALASAMAGETSSTEYAIVAATKTAILLNVSAITCYCCLKSMREHFINTDINNQHI